MAPSKETKPTPAECRARAHQLMREADAAADLDVKGRLLREAVIWLSRASGLAEK
jgi:hypothetical protein